MDLRQLLLFNELKAKAEALQQEVEQEEIRYTRRNTTALDTLKL